MTILIDLSVAGINTGPFNLYSDADGYVTAFALNVTRQQLLDGYPAVVPNDTLNIKLQSLSDICPNDTILPVITTTTTTSTSTSSTTTTSTTATPTTTTTTTTAQPCNCVYFYSTSNTIQEISYISCEGTLIYDVISPEQTKSFCGCCGEAFNPDVEITYGATCVDGSCIQTTTTTTTTAT
jgi:hypothetical protein